MPIKVERPSIPIPSAAAPNANPSGLSHDALRALIGGYGSANGAGRQQPVAPSAGPPAAATTAYSAPVAGVAPVHPWAVGVKPEVTMEFLARHFGTTSPSGGALSNPSTSSAQSNGSHSQKRKRADVNGHAAAGDESAPPSSKKKSRSGVHMRHFHLPCAFRAGDPPPEKVICRFLFN